jgi:serine phosphatase RsbU (regulator of sigma subunit)
MPPVFLAMAADYRYVQAPHGGARLLRKCDRRQLPSASFPLTRGNGATVETDERSGMDRRALGFISRTRLFRDVPYCKVEELLAACPLVECAPGTPILEAGHPSQTVWIVVEGKLQVHLDAPDSDNFMEIPAGECVGEISACDGLPATAWVIVAEPSRLLAIEQDVFLDRILTVPQVGRNLVTLLAERMRESNRRIGERVRMETELHALQRELEFAHRIQSSMLPLAPLFPGEPRLACHGFMRAAHRVGGDFYDALRLDEQRYLVAIGDVCNKGMPAALFMAQTLALLRSLLRHTPDSSAATLAALLEETSAQLCRNNSEHLFVSIFLAVIDLATDEIRFVNAGHNPPVLVPPGQAAYFVWEPHDPVAGIVTGLAFEGGCLPFPPGSRLLMYTDGVTEAVAPDGTAFGEDALLACVSEALPTATALVDEIARRVDRFVAGQPQADDITLLALYRAG